MGLLFSRYVCPCHLLHKFLVAEPYESRSADRSTMARFHAHLGYGPQSWSSQDTLVKSSRRDSILQATWSLQARWTGQ